MALNLHSNQNVPRDFMDRHGHILPAENSNVQKRLNDIKHYVDIHKLKFNKSKTNIRPFNFSTKYAFFPRLTFDNEELEVVQNFKLL